MRKILCTVFVILLCAGITSANQHFYIKKAGNDSYSGLSDDSAWGSVTGIKPRMDIPNPTILPGDTLSLNAGDTLIGMLRVTVKLVINKYGSGNDPIINAQHNPLFESCISLESGDSTAISDIVCDSAYQDGIASAGMSGIRIFRGQQMHSGSDGIKQNAGGSMYLEDVWTHDNGDDGASAHAGTLTIRRGKFRHNGTDGVHNIATAIAVINNASLDSNINYGINMGLDRNNYSNMFTSCTLRYNGSSFGGIQLTDSTNALADSCVFYGGAYGVHSVSNGTWTVQNSSFYNQTFAAVFLEGGAGYKNFQHNFIKGCTGDYSVITGTGTGMNAFYNKFWDCSGFNFYDAFNCFGNVHNSDASSSSHYAYRIAVNNLGNKIENCYVNSSGGYAVRDDGNAFTMNNCAFHNGFNGSYSTATTGAVITNCISDNTDLPAGNSNVNGANFASYFQSTDTGSALYAIPLITGGAYKTGVNPSISGITKYFNNFAIIPGSVNIGAMGNPCTDSIMLYSPSNGATNIAINPTLTWKTSGSAPYQLQVSTSSGFSSMVFNQSGITDTTQNLTNLSNNTIYYWRVNPSNANNACPGSSSWSFTTIIAVPPAPILSSPSNGAVNIAVSPTLTWAASSGAASYRVQVSKTSNFSNIVFDSSGIIVTSLVLAGLLNDSTYYWHVNATNIGGIGDWSATANFTIITTLPSAVILISPKDSAILSADSIVLIWQKGAPAVTAYMLEVAKDSGFTNLLVQDSSLTDTIKLVRALTGESFWWQVKAKNGVGWGPFSAKRRFTHPSTSVLPKQWSMKVFGCTQSDRILRYSLPEQCRVILRYYNVSGRLIISLINRVQNAGYYSISIPMSWWAKGTYVQEFQAGNFVRKDKFYITR